MSAREKMDRRESMLNVVEEEVGRKNKMWPGVHQIKYEAPIKLARAPLHDRVWQAPSLAMFCFSTTSLSEKDRVRLNLTWNQNEEKGRQV